MFATVVFRLWCGVRRSQIDDGRVGRDDDYDYDYDYTTRTPRAGADEQSEETTLHNFVDEDEENRMTINHCSSTTLRW